MSVFSVGTSGCCSKDVKLNKKKKKMQKITGIKLLFKSYILDISVTAKGIKLKFSEYIVWEIKLNPNELWTIKVFKKGVFAIY